MNYDFEIEKIVENILKSSAKKILLQLPDGLKPYGLKIAEELRRKTNVKIYVSADPCYGACDLAVYEAEILNIDLLIHVGHTPFHGLESKLKSKLKTMYVEARINLDVNEIVEEAVSLLRGYRKIGLITTVQHIHQLGEVKQTLEKHGFNVFIGSAGGLVKYDGQVIGCDYTTAKKISDTVEVFLFFGGGVFHPLGVLLMTGKPVVAVDPYTKKVQNLKSLGEEILKKRKVALAKFVQAKKVGILVGLKLGQSNPELAEKIQEKLEEIGKHTTLLSVREITPEVLENFPEIEVFVNTACPRVGIDDSSRYRRPIISVEEVLCFIKNKLTEKND
ncbi:diphthamide biosynthesis enzyme Dph2 [Candidatus Bathyarchaeota archaeon]|mgnify:CR=1 FL=1|nr:MAG: diphthamide biosynthesis enzyme Dph2 [Candidatus Bathyarchaeota archaeon]